MNSFEKLGIPNNSSAEEIKSAYRKLAKEFHPDSPSGKGDAVKFNEITIAYKDALEQINKSDEFLVFELNDEVEISVKESLVGFKKVYDITSIERCDCGSYGAKCLRCKGTGYIQVGFSRTTTCPRCNGFRFENPNECYKCNGSGSKLVVEPIKLQYEGVTNHGEIRSYNYSRGKINIKFSIKKSSYDLYDRDGNDLIYLAQIDPVSPILGGTLHIPRLGAESVQIKYPENCVIPSYYVIPNSGVPGTNGKMIVVLKVNNDMMDLRLIPKIRKAIRS